MAHWSSVVLGSKRSITAHQRQINNSITSKDIVLSENTMSAIFTDLRFTVCHYNLHARLGSAFLMLK